MNSVSPPMVQVCGTAASSTGQRSSCVTLASSTRFVVVRPPAPSRIFAPAPDSSSLNAALPAMSIA